MYIPEDDTFVNDDHASALLEEMNSELTDNLLPVTIFVGIEACIGFIGNTLVVVLFAFHYKPCNYRTFSICLSLIDLTCTFTTMAGEMVTQRYWFNYPVKEICKAKDFFNICTVSAETFCLLMISIDRYRKICRPLEWQIGSKAAAALCLGVVAVAAVISSPVVEFWGVRTYTKEYKNTTVLITSCEKDEKYEDTKFPFGYVAFVGGLICACLVAMFVLNVAVAKNLIYERRRGLLSKQRYAKRFAKTNKITPGDEGDRHTTLRVKDTPENSEEAGSERKLTQSEIKDRRIRRKALILFIMTSTFICTTIMYLTMLSILGSAADIVNGLSAAGKTAFFFFLRFYFIQHIINPILNVMLDPQIKSGLLALSCRKHDFK